MAHVVRTAAIGLVGLLLAVMLGLGILLVMAWRPMGQVPSLAEAKANFSASPQWRAGRFRNQLAQQPVDKLAAGEEFLLPSNPNVEPRTPLQFTHNDGRVYRQAPASGLRVTWLGHSNLLIEIDGKNLLIDPVWGARASPLSFAGAKYFYPVPLALESLPRIDGILISHDHYDHLDVSTVDRLKGRGVNWYVPLGVGTHLRYWGVQEKLIHELDWWQSATIGKLQLTAVPARHGSGRSVFMQDVKQTLWAGWALNGPKHSVIYTGDTSMHPGFTEIGRRLGPFDLSIIEIGAYNQLWRDNHLGPEQALKAHQMLNADTLLPVHWGAISLANHSWTEPIERLLAAVAANAPEVVVQRPVPGQAFELTEKPRDRWWPQLPWKNAEQSPICSTKVPC
ncbi:MAG: MBL fold metallo-hydrolase [Cellvibrionaceae bacterium]|nr:MBL fold metallo-hydrolase [Cellvibrionaceae bacterium]MCV6626783.1 MBL fold metallo-hydrolase [Cellvibrionaceae bacterium]